MTLGRIDYENRRILCSVPDCPSYAGFDTILKRHGHLSVWRICRRHWGRLTKVERATLNRLERLRRRFGGEEIEARYVRCVRALIRRAA